MILRFLTFVRRRRHSLQAVDRLFMKTALSGPFSDLSTTEAVVLGIRGRIGL